MTLTLDPQVAAATESVYAAMRRTEPLPVGDWQRRRRSLDKMFARLVAEWPDPLDVLTTRVVASWHRSQVECRLYQREDPTVGPLVVYAHGGGMISCGVDTHEPIGRRIAHETGVAVLSVDFRFAPEHPFPASVEDVFTALQWACASLADDPARVVLMGDSAGGGIAAAVSLMARDRGAARPAAQVLVYPMLDDRTKTADPDAAPWLMWSPDDNVTAWQCLLGDAYGTDDVSPYASPARATDLTGLPRTYLDVGQLDLYCQENLAFASRLAASGVDLELHVYPGAPHAFELFAPHSDQARSAWANRMAFISKV